MAVTRTYISYLRAYIQPTLELSVECSNHNCKSSLTYAFKIFNIQISLTAVVDQEKRSMREGHEVGIHQSDSPSSRDLRCLRFFFRVSLVTSGIGDVGSGTPWPRSRPCP